MSADHCPLTRVATSVPPIPTSVTSVVNVRQKHTLSDRLLDKVLQRNHKTSKMNPNDGLWYIEELYTKMKFTNYYADNIPVTLGDEDLMWAKNSFIEFGETIIPGHFTEGSDRLLTDEELAAADELVDAMPPMVVAKAKALAKGIRGLFETFLKEVFDHIQPHNQLTADDQQKYNKMKSFVDRFKGSHLIAPKSRAGSPHSTGRDSDLAIPAHVVQEVPEDVDQQMAE